MLKDSNYRSHG